MASFTAGTTFVDGVANDVTAAKLGALVTNATPTSGLIQDRTAETVVATNDTFLIGDASDSNTLKRMTVANVMKAELTGTINTTAGTITTLNSTTGTITGLNTTTGTIANLNSTTGTVATLNSTTGTITGLNTTTGTIANLSATTSTFLGAITGSTNVINIGSGQIYKDASGNVSIGTTSATSKLHIYGTGSTASNPPTSGTLGATLTIQDFGSTYGNGGMLMFGAFQGTHAAIKSYLTNGVSNTTGDLLFCTRTNATNTTLTEAMRVTGDGNVGIGSTSPDAKLEIEGVGSTASNPSTTSSIDATIGIRSGIGSGNGGMLMFGATQGYFSAIKGFLTNGGSNTTGDLLFCTRTNATNTTLTEAMRVTGDGNVGIGATAPVNKLEVVGSFGRGAPVTKTADFTLASTENWIIVNKATTSCTATLPAASSWTGREFTIKTLQALTVVSASANVVPINGTTAGTAILPAASGSWATLVSNGTNWVIMAS